MPGPDRARLASVHWCDDQALPDDVRRWFAERKVFALVARIAQPEGFDLADFLAHADLHVELRADRKPAVGVRFDAGCWWGKGDHAFVAMPFVAADRRDLVPGAAYQVVPRNDGKEALWDVGEVRVVRQAAGR